MDQMDRKLEHGYRLSYAREVGSSFDPDMEDMEDWIHEFQVSHPLVSSFYK